MPEPVEAGAPSGPLAGVRVVAVEQAVAGPLCTRHLADLGADVVKVERPGGGDFARGYDTVAHGTSAHFVWLNRAKRSVVLDLKAPEGRTALHDLLLTADVLVSNLGVGAVDRLVDVEAVRRANPGLVTCAVSGYGPDGPYAHRKAFDLLVTGEAGVTLATGTPEAPAKPGVSVADLAGGAYAVAAVCAALFERSRTGVGRHVDIALFDVMTEWMMPLLLAESLTGHSVPPAGMHHATITPYGPYRCADGRLVNLAVQNDAQWRRLCHHVLGDDRVASDPRFRTNADRLRHREACEQAVQEAVGGLDRDRLVEALDAADLPWGDLSSTRDVLDHPQLVQTGRWRTAVVPGGHQVPVLADPFRFAGRTAGPPARVPAYGADTAEVLAGLASHPQPAP